MDEVVQTVYYTSAGYLLRTNDTGDSDGGAPFHFTLVTPDGTAKKIDLTLGEVVPSTDADQPYLAYAETAASGQISVVVLDVTNGDEVARVDVPGKMTWAGWGAPPVALDGDHVYVGTDDVTQVVDWRTGEVTTTDVVTGYPSISNGRAVVSAQDGLRIVDVATGDAVFTSDGKGSWFARLSPDGRYALVYDQMQGPQDAEIYSLDSGAHVPIDGEPYGYGFTPAGDLFHVSAKGVEVCTGTTGECTTTPLAEGVHLDDAVYFVRVAGVAYES